MKNSTTLFLLLFLLLIAIAVGAFQWFRQSEMGEFQESFPATAFLETPLRFSGNQYYLDASVESIIASEDGLGRIIMVSPDMGGSSLPIFLPSGVSGNVAFQQRYRFMLSVESGGLLFVNDMRKN